MYLSVNQDSDKGLQIPKRNMSSRGHFKNFVSSVKQTKDNYINLND